LSKINDIIGELNKDPKLTTFNQTDSGEIMDWYPTLIPVFDYNMVGGVPASGRVSQAFGKPSSGKSTFSGNVMKNAIKMGAIVVYFDLEGTQNNSRLEALGVDTSKVLTYTTTRKKDGTMQELSIEEIGKTIIDTLAKVYEADPNQQVLFIWDSVAISDSEMQTNTELGNQVVGQQAKALATVGRKLQVNLIHNNGTLLAINQARDDFNAMNPRYASVKTVGGKGWEHLLSTNISLAQSGKLKAKSTDTEPIGTTTRVKVVKSKVGDNWGSDFTMCIIGESGYDFEYNLVNSAQENGLITTGRSPKYVNDNGDEIKGSNVYNLVQKLKKPENQAIRDEIWQRLLLMYFPKCYPPLFNTKPIHARTRLPYD
jgi:recombination protein RecA